MNLRINPLVLILELGILFSLTPLFAQNEESLSITTYYPSPNAVFNELRIWPQNSPTTTPCNQAHEGQIYFQSIANSDHLFICRYNGTGYFWLASGEELYWDINAASMLRNYEPGRFNPVCIGTDYCNKTSIKGPSLTVVESGIGDVEVARFSASAGGNPYIKISGSDGSFQQKFGTIKFDKANKTMVVGNGVFISEQGNVGIGVSQPKDNLEIEKGGDIHTQNIIWKQTDGTPTEVAQVSLWNDWITFKVSPGGGNLNTAITMQSTGGSSPTYSAFCIGSQLCGGGVFTLGGDIRVGSLANDPVLVGDLVGYEEKTGILVHFPKSTSDLRLKKDISSLSSRLNVLEALDKMRAVYFRWDTSKEKVKGLDNNMHIGMIAQEVEPQLPELVNTGSDGYKSLDYEKLSVFLIEVCKENELKIKINDGLYQELDKTYQELERELNALGQEGNSAKEKSIR